MVNASYTRGPHLTCPPPRCDKASHGRRLRGSPDFYFSRVPLNTQWTQKLLLATSSPSIRQNLLHNFRRVLLCAPYARLHPHDAVAHARTQPTHERLPAAGTPRDRIILLDP